MTTTSSNLRNFAWVIAGIILMAFLVVADTTISDTRISTVNVDVSSILKVATINNVSLMNMDEGPLIFATDSKAFAVFNGNITQTLALVQTDPTLEASAGTVSFFGSVNNIDNINDQSRFRETNLNNGTSATSAFVAVNDKGFSTSFGIGSSQFEFAGIEFNNDAAIFHDSPGKFNFANGRYTAWNWRANRDNSSILFNFTESMQLSPEGNLNVAGNFTGHSIQFRGFEPKADCNLDIAGTIMYEENGTKGDFFGCTQLNLLTFVWKKL